jgi:alginate O-acetyltransferase complex protein AlgI
MVFASAEFLTLFLPLFFIAYLATQGRGRNLVLLIASWIFYGWWKPVFLLLLWAVTVVGFVFGRAIEAAPTDRGKQRLLVWGAVVNLALLAWFKYANLAVGTTNDALSLLDAGHIAWDPVILPIGLSFYILQAISYLYDVRRGVVKAEPSLVAFAVFIAMFSQLIAGPVIRYRWVDKELASRRLDFSNFSTGARRFMIGFAMKVLIADSLAPLVNAAFTLPRPSLADAWVGTGAYSLQLYFDFAGYSAMAIGLGLMLGFHFPENFNNPYLATSIQDFWRRWHISLSGWLRDYLYIALGGNRVGKVRIYVNLILTMAIGGLWHGAAWTFAAWGLLHGLALAVERLAVHRGIRLPSVLSYPLTMAVVLIAWTLFRASDWSAAQTMLMGQFGLHEIGLSAQLSLALHPAVVLWLGLGLAVVWWPALETRLPGGGLILPRWWQALWPVVTFIYALAVLEGHETVPFLYFQF